MRVKILCFMSVYRPSVCYLVGSSVGQTFILWKQYLFVLWIGLVRYKMVICLKRHVSHDTRGLLNSLTSSILAFFCFEIHGHRLVSMSLRFCWARHEITSAEHVIGRRQILIQTRWPDMTRWDLYGEPSEKDSIQVGKWLMIFIFNL